jgi:hypothetical protein
MQRRCRLRKKTGKRNRSDRERSGQIITAQKKRGGEGEIRTLGAVTHTTVFETVPFGHSGTSPKAQRMRQVMRFVKGVARSGMSKSATRPILD